MFEGVGRIRARADVLPVRAVQLRRQADLGEQRALRRHAARPRPGERPARLRGDRSAGREATAWRCGKTTPCRRTTGCWSSNSPEPLTRQSCLVTDGHCATSQAGLPAAGRRARAPATHRVRALFPPRGAGGGRRHDRCAGGRGEDDAVQQLRLEGDAGIAAYSECLDTRGCGRGERCGGTPAEKLLAVFDVFDGWFRGGLRGLRVRQGAVGARRAAPPGAPGGRAPHGQHPLLSGAWRARRASATLRIRGAVAILMAGSIVAAYAGDRNAARRAKAVGLRLLGRS